MIFRDGKREHWVSLSHDACGLDQVMGKDLAGRRGNSERAPRYWQSRFQAISITVPGSIGSGACQAAV
jgi:hypothetical protein